MRIYSRIKDGEAVKLDRDAFELMLAEREEDFRKRALSPNTRRGYESDWKNVIDWCNELGLPLGFLLTGGQTNDCTQAIALLGDRHPETVPRRQGL